MGFWEDLAAFTEPHYGVVSVNRNPGEHSTDNGLLFTATAFLLAKELKETIPTERYAQFINFIWQCSLVPGVYKRYPDAPYENKFDDLVGIAAFSYAYTTLHATAIWRFGDTHHWCWNLEDLNKFTFRNWWGRQAGFKGFIEACAGFDLTLWDQFLFTVGCLMVVFEPYGNTNGKCLQYLKNKSVWNKGRLSDWGISFWRKRMKRMYPGGLKELYKIYFPNHGPLVDYAPEDFL